MVELADSARTAADAAAALGCEVGQIVKSLVFRTRETRRGVLVLASGSNRVDEKALARRVGERIERADAEFVRATTGFAIGGVPPIGHAQALVAFLDEDLFRYQRIFAAAGHPHAIFELTPAELASMTGGTVVRVA